MLDLYDTNNWARVKFETDSSGLPLRNLFNAAYYSPNPSVFFFDGFNAKALRLAIYDKYKSGRKPASDNFYLMLKVFKELLLHTHHVVVDVPGYEADDVIGTFAKANPTVEMQILSTDRDFCALLREGLTTPMANMKGVEAKDVRLWKTLCGDTGDTIPGIKGFGKKAFEALDELHKLAWLKHLEGSDLFTAEYLGLVKPSHIKEWEANRELLRIYWQIIGFYDVPMELIAKHTRVGKPDLTLANSKLKEMLQ